MKELGMSFGDLRPNGFFWKRIAHVDRPRRFAALMGMTLEQANLDFALHYREAFLRVGDQCTASLIDAVYKDEIAHVAHGAHWFGALSDDRACDPWQSYCEEIDGFLSPRFARGTNFDRAGRVAARLPPSIIDHLETWTKESTRRAKLWVFNADCEIRCANPDHQVLHKKLDTIIGEQSQLLLWLAPRSDQILTREEPSAAFYQQFPQSTPFPTVLLESGIRPDPQTSVYWGPQQSVSSQHEVDLLAKHWSFMLRQRWLSESPDASECSAHFDYACQTSEKVKDAIRQIADAGFAQAVVKANYGASGRGLKRIETAAIDDPKFFAWVSRMLLQQGGVVIVEPWYERWLDFGVQAIVQADGHVRILGMTRNLCDKRGQFLGQTLGSLWSCLPEEVSQDFHATGASMSMLERIRAATQYAGQSLAAAGYTGPFSLDAFIGKDSSGNWRVRSLSELNVRYTMGHVAHGIKSKLSVSAPMLWYFFRRTHTNWMGFEDLSSVYEYFSKQHPPVFKKSSLRSGVLAVTDPWLAKDSVPLIFVGRSTMRNAALETLIRTDLYSHVRTKSQIGDLFQKS
jgi:hypothetical protein